MHSTRQLSITLGLTLLLRGTQTVARNLFAAKGTLLATTLTAIAVIGQTTAFAQSNATEVSPPSAAATAPMDAAEIATLLEKGKVLERQNRWLEVLALYEDALHAHPDAEPLRQRHLLAEIHCDLDRRLADTTFQDYVSVMTEAQALDMLNEIILKIETHYVQDPMWQQLAWRGTANLDIAVTKTTARNRFLSTATDDQINSFRHTLRNDVNKRQVQSRRDVQNLAAYAARIASQELNMKPAAAIVEYCCGVVNALDKYSSYLTGSQLDDVYGQIEGNFVGLGIELKADDGNMRIVKVITGGPAATAGVVAGDRIVAIDGKLINTLPMDEATELLKGPIHSLVNVALANDHQATRTVRVRRDRVEVPSVEDAQIADPANGVAYFKISSFQKTTSQDVDQALWELHRQGMRSLIVDLRGNPGGLLTAAVEISDKFLAEGTIVTTNGRSSREDFDYSAHRTGTWRVPLVVLIDHDSASASEIFAGAIRDNARGTIVGERSYGKGSVQGIFPLSASKVGVRLTTAKFFSPNGQPISDRGVEPHRVVRTVARPDMATAEIPSAATDVMLEAALDTARQLSVAHR